MSDLNISNFIWNIADDVLRDVYVRGKYRDVILPMTVIRRLDAVLEPTKDAVLAMKVQLDKAGVANLNRPGFTGVQNSRRIARYGTDIKEENREAVFT